MLCIGGSVAHGDRQVHLPKEVRECFMENRTYELPLAEEGGISQVNRGKKKVLPGRRQAYAKACQQHGELKELQDICYDVNVSPGSM